MSILMMLALSRKGMRPAITLPPFTTSQPFTIPAGVTVLKKVIGKGSDGSGGSYNESSITISSVGVDPSQSGGTALIRNSVFTPAATETEKFRGSGTRTVSYTRRIYTVGPDDLTRLTSSFQTSVRVRGDRIDSSFTGGSANSAITYSDSQATVRVRIVKLDGGTNGSASTGFGKTFPGGIGEAAQELTFENVPVVAGQQYQLNIPAGGSITITYEAP